MTPKEKAKELVDKYYNFNTDENPFEWCTEIPIPVAKQCALICVEEIIEFGNNSNIREPMMYWNKVKEEIEKL
jgi:hypothetical protein